jgi:hypothetical protein
MQTAKMKKQSDRAKVNKKLKCKEQGYKERYRIFKFWVLICHFYFWPLIFEFVWGLVLGI